MRGHRIAAQERVAGDALAPTTLSEQERALRARGDGQERRHRREQVGGDLAVDGHQPARLQTIDRSRRTRAPSFPALPPPPQHVQHRRRPHPALLQHHEHVVQEVRALLGQALVRLALGGQNDLRRLLTDLLEARVDPLRDEAGRVGAVRPLPVRAARSRAPAPPRCRPRSASPRRSRSARPCGSSAPRGRPRAAGCRRRSRGAASRACSTWPEVSPFFQRAPRLRLQKCASPVRAVRSSASALAQATIEHVAAGAVLHHDGHEPAASNCTPWGTVIAHPPHLHPGARAAAAWRRPDGSRRSGTRTRPGPPLALPFRQHLRHVRDGAAAPGGDDGHGHRLRHRAR